MLETSVVLTVSQWDNYKELHLMQDAAPPYFAPPVHTQHDN
jgi:hypothetical protein